MPKFRSIVAPLVLVFSLSVVASYQMASAQEHIVELIDGVPKAEDVPEEFSKLMADKGFRIKRGATRTVSEIWLCKEWEVEEDFEETDERLYPFTPGQLIGVLHLTRRGADFRDQTLSSGWYSLRFGLQPVDGNHEGTSPTRDFLIVVNIENDEPDKEWDDEELNEVGAEAAGSTHPAMICLQRATKEDKLAVRHDEANDWWILHAIGKGIAGNEKKDVPIDLVVAGHAAE